MYNAHLNYNCFSLRKKKYDLFSLKTEKNRIYEVIVKQSKNSNSWVTLVLNLMHNLVL